MSYLAARSSKKVRFAAVKFVEADVMVAGMSILFALDWFCCLCSGV